MSRRYDLRGSKDSSTSILQEVLRKSQKRPFSALEFKDLPVADAQETLRALLVDPEIERRCLRVNYNAVAKSLRVEMPTHLHDCQQMWLCQHLLQDWGHLLSPEEIDLVNIAAGTTFNGFTGPYSGSSKEPDLWLKPNSQTLPSVVFESGWSESFPRLHRDVKLWFSNKIVRKVILSKWTLCTQNRVKGVLEVWNRGTEEPQLEETHTVFPVPDPVPPNFLVDQVRFTKEELFGAYLPQGSDPACVLHLDLSRLRKIAKEKICNEMHLSVA